MTKVETNEKIAWEPQVGKGGIAPLTDTAPQGAFGAEFRELARQRRFLKSSTTPPAARTTVTLDATVTPAVQEPAPTPSPTPAPAAAPAAATPATAATRITPDPAADAFAQAFNAALPSRRMSDDAPTMLAELAKMSDRLVATREELAATKLRAEHVEQLLVDANARLMAARVLVQDAQQATRQSAERSAWLEGRCDTLQDALELAVNASVLTRWKWRRQARAAATSEH